MKKYLIGLISIFIVLFAINSSSRLFNYQTSFDSLKTSLQELGICLNVDEETWTRTTKSDPNLESTWRYFCDNESFEIHKMSANTDFDELFLLEAKVNHSSGAYDNYVIKKINGKYEIDRIQRLFG